MIVKDLGLSLHSYKMDVALISNNLLKQPLLYPQHTHTHTLHCRIAYPKYPLTAGASRSNE